jgi:hypothetical protein
MRQLTAAVFIALSIAGASVPATASAGARCPTKC